MKYKTSFFKSSILNNDDIINIRNIAIRYENIIKKEDTLSIREIRKIILEDLCKKYCEDILNKITNKRLLGSLQSYTIKVIGILSRNNIPIDKESNYVTKEECAFVRRYIPTTSIYVPIIDGNVYLGTYILYFTYMIEIEMIEKNKLDIIRTWRIIPFMKKDVNRFEFYVKSSLKYYYETIKKIQNDKIILSKLKNFKMKIEDICTELNFYDESLNLNPLFKITNGKVEIYR